MNSQLVLNYQFKNMGKEILYKVSEKQLKLKEYGRNIQAMVEHILTVEDRNKRTKLALEIIRIMGNVNPQLRDNPEYKRKLWDHLFFLADYQLDIDVPFTIPTKEEAKKTAPPKVPYKTGKPRFRQYGRNVEIMLKAASETDNEIERKGYVNLAANLMKQFLRNQNRETNSEQMICDHIHLLSNQQISVEVSDIQFYKTMPKKDTQNHHNHNNQHKHKKKQRRRK